MQDVRQRDLPLFDAQLLDAGERPLLPGPLLRCLHEEVGQVCHRPGPQDGCGGETKVYQKISNFTLGFCLEVTNILNMSIHIMYSILVHSTGVSCIFLSLKTTFPVFSCNFMLSMDF